MDDPNCPWEIRVKFESAYRKWVGNGLKRNQVAKINRAKHLGELSVSKENKVARDLIAMRKELRDEQRHSNGQKEIQ